MTLVHRHLWMKLLHPVARSFCLPYRPGRLEHLGRQGPRVQPEPPDPLVQQELLDLLGPPDLPGLMEIRGPQDL